MYVVQMRKKREMTIVIQAPKVRMRPLLLQGGKHCDQRRRARSTERVLLRRESEN